MKRSAPSASAFFALRAALAVVFVFAAVTLFAFAFDVSAQERQQRSAAAPTPARADAGHTIQAAYNGVLSVTQFDVSPALRDIPPVPATKGGIRENEDRAVGVFKVRFAPEWDPVAQPSLSADGTRPASEIPAPSASFDAQPNTANAAPPDPVGSVGPNHVVTMANLSFQVFTRTGTSLYGPAANNTLWTGFGGPCQNENAGDPIVIYDRLADRWLLSQFTSAGPSYFFCVAISTTGDPTGSYYRYAVPTGPRFPDYPKVGVWPDAYYVSTREFSGSAYAGVGAYALNRAQALAGDPNAAIISFFAPPSPTYTIGDGLLPSDIDGMMPPPPGSPNYFVGSMDNNGPYGAPQDALLLWKFTANWANPAASSFTLTHTVPVAPFNSILGICGGTRACIPQPGTTNRIDHLGYRQRPLFRLAYRNFGTHESLVTNQSVSAGAGSGGEVSGVRWWEVRLSSGTPVVHQQGTFAPGLTDGIHRWMGAAAIDAQGNIGLAYSAGNATLFPSIYYTGRLASDPPGTMPQGEGIIHTGTGSQTGGGNRWGDYTSLSVDPVDDMTFWHTNQYLPTTSERGWRIRVGAFKVSQAPAPARGTARFTLSDCFNQQAVSGVTVTINGSVYGVTSAAGVYDAPLPPGQHSYTLTKAGYRPRTGTVNVTNGGLSQITDCVESQPILTSAGSVIVSAGPNGVLDPGETVTVALGVKNTNVCTSSAFTAALQASGGVTNPSPAQNYGTLCGLGGAPAFRTFTFTVDPSAACGSTVTASLSLVDGPDNYGTATYTFTVGTVVANVVENFDTVTAPNLPAGWTASASGSGQTGRTITTFPDTAPNAVFLSEQTTVGVSSVTSAPITIQHAGSQIAFRNQFNTEAGYDGVVLDISINGGAFQDILAAGGSFMRGGYTGAVNACCSNPFPGRQAWHGLSGGTAAAPAYIDTVVNLPAAAAGQTIQLRWSLGSDNTTAPTTNPGARIDSIRLLRNICGGSAPAVASAVSRKAHGVAGMFDVPLPIVPYTGSIGVEPRTGGVASEHQVIVTFSSPVTIGSASINGGEATLHSATMTGTTATLNLSNVANRQRLSVTLANVFDGVNAGSIHVPLGILLGDTNGSGSVSATDISQTKAQSGATTNGSNFRTDVNLSGAINATDISAVKARSGDVLP
jgi:hypothetical protein